MGKGHEVIAEFPKAWLKGLNKTKQVCSAQHDAEVNKYGVSCGVCLGQWESSGWIGPLDPYGWFQWYCRFFLGRRTSDDDRQIGRFRKITALRRGQLCASVVESRTSCHDAKTSPLLRQALQHWGYRLTQEHLQAYRKKNNLVS